MIVLLYSGGIDSTVLLYDLLTHGEEVAAVGFDYAQRHLYPEASAARRICDDLGVSFTQVKLPQLRGSALTDRDDDGPVVVPNRNMVMLATAGALAVSYGAASIAIACHAGDYDLFPDCRPQFLEEMFRALRYSTGLGLRYPYVRLSKVEIVRLGVRLGVPFDQTWSCYREGPEPCGECLACGERREALFLAGAPV